MNSQASPSKNRSDNASYKDQIEAAARKGGALTFGVADATAFTAAAHGHRPEDLLPDACSVIVLGGAKPRSGDWASPNFQHLELSTTSDRVTGLCMRLAHMIERELGYYALVVPPGVDEGQRPFLSLSLAAELAGCGTASLAGPILNDEHGFVYLGALITTLPLPVDGPLDKPVCPAPECVQMYEQQKRTPCTAVCSIEDDGCLDGQIEDGRWVERIYDQARCTARTYNHWIPSFQKVLADTLDEPDTEKRRMKINSSLFTRTLWSMTYANISQGQCFECIRVCPVDERSRKLR